MKIIVREWLENKKALVLLIALFILRITSLIINARFVIWISDAITDYHNIGYHIKNIIIWSIVAVVISAISEIVNHLCTNRMYTRLIEKYADGVLDNDINMFTKYSCAHILTSNAALWDISIAGLNAMQLVINVVNILIQLTAMYLIAGSMIIPVIVVYLAGFVMMRFLFKAFNKYDSEVHQIKKARNQEMENIINGFYEVRSFNNQNHHRSVIKKYNEANKKVRDKRSLIDAIIAGGVEAIDSIGLIAVLLYVASMLANGSINPATGMSLVMYVFRIIAPLLGILNFADEISERSAACPDYDKIVNYKNEDKLEETNHIRTFNVCIRIDDLWFCYDINHQVLHDINIEIKKGQKIGICGSSGNGKSTLLKLINRFYHGYSGSITMDGLPIDSIKADDYYSIVGSVSQDNTIFPGTIKENIAYANYDKSDDEIIAAAKKAKLYDFIMGTKDKFDTVVGPRGINLSGGQKQRIALARLFLKSPDVILLDEATSALDNDSETFIQDAIDQLEGKTIITVAHRLSTIKNSDVIYVLGDDGTVVESGTHDELMEYKGVYFGMYR